MGNTTGCAVHNLINKRADIAPDAVAVAAPSRSSLSYRRLRDQVNETARVIRAAGLGRRDRIAIVLPNGPEMAVAFLSVASCAACAPLNPAYRAQEFEFYLSDIGAKALIVPSGVDSPAIAVAQALGLSIIRLSPVVSAEAGVFMLDPDSGAKLREDGWVSPEPQDVALMLHTSGTTGRPKLVALTQENLCVSAQNIKTSLQLSNTDRCLNVMPLFHVHGMVGAMLSTVAAGGSIFCTPGFSAAQFLEWMAEFEPTWYTAVPTMHQALLARIRSQEQSIGATSLRFIRSCSSALPPRLMAQLEQTFGVPVVEAYGMSEASHQISINPLPPGERKPGSVGMAVGQEVGIMDGADSLLPTGSVGEIVIRGPNVIRAYGDQSSAGQPTPLGNWFRTGDQGFLDSDGYIFITGRIKEMINRGGEKISPREVDEAVLEHPAVEEAVTFAVADAKLGQDVAAAVVVRRDQSATETEIQEFVAARLADFKVPRRVVFLTELPKTATGKIQRSGLAERLGLVNAGADASGGPAAFASPRTSTETLLCEIWRDLLKIARVGIHDNFFDLGGDSLLAMQLILRLEEATGLELSMVVLFHRPTIVGLAEWIDSPEAAQAVSKIPAIRKVQTDGELPTSFGEQRMWFLAQYTENRAVYVTPTLFRMEGPLDVEALEQSLGDLVERHPILRTTFHNREGTLVRRTSAAQPVSLSKLDLRSVPAAERFSQALQAVMEQFEHPFDLSRDPMLRATLVKLADEDHLLLLEIHHIAADDWSRRVLVRELSAFYEGRISNSRPALPDLKIQYGDFAYWQRQWLQPDILEKEMTYWKQRLAGLATLQLPTDRPRLARQTYRGGREAVLLPESLCRTVREVSRREGVTIFMTLLAAFQALLHRYTGQDDITVGAPITNRSRAGTEGLVGFLSNTLVLRADLSDDPKFGELLGRARDRALEAYAHQDVPFEKLVELLHPDRSLSQSPLFQTMFVFNNVPSQALAMPGLKTQELEVENGTAKVDLTLSLTDSAGEIRGFLEYNTDLFEAATARRIVDHYARLLEIATKDVEQRVSQLSFLTERERERLLVEWNATEREYPRRCVQELFEEQVERTPDAVAVVCEKQQLTYRELSRRSNQLGHRLRSLGVGPEVFVAVCMERSLEMVVGLLGVLKAGGAYIPLDSEYPKERLAGMIEDSRPLMVLTQKRLLDRLPPRGVPALCLDADWNLVARESIATPEATVTPENAVYAIYTSGSTGKPKAVVNTHKGIVNRLLWMQDTYCLSADDAVLQKTSCAFDVSVWEFFWPLMTGARLVLARPGGHRDPAYLGNLISCEKITTLHFVPSMLRAFLQAADLPKNTSIRRVFCSGEALTVDLQEMFFPRVDAELHNLYGPTEAAVDVTYWSCQRWNERTSVPIGRPIANTQIYILDRHLQPTPVGVPGQLHIGGIGLARGYLNQPELTAEKFIRNPLSPDPDARLYKTGDLARFWPGGEIEYLGRLDDQIKLRGFRIELGEVESVLRVHPEVRECLVVAREDGSQGSLLIAYVVPAGARALATNDLIGFLKLKLPDYMLPSKFVFLAGIPLAPNGKIDRRALPAPEKTQSEAPLAPRDVLELQLTKIWEELLGMESVGVKDNFFELGGHSLSAVQLLCEIQRCFGKELSVPSIFEAPTIEQLAGVLRKEGYSAASPHLVPLQPVGSRPPLFCVHGLGGDVFEYLHLARYLGPERPVYGLQAHTECGLPAILSLGEMAARYVREIRAFQPEGPYFVGGHSAGGTIAFEVAQQLQAEGQTVALLAFFDAVHPQYLPSLLSRRWTRRVPLHLRQIAGLSFREKAAYLGQRAKTIKERIAKKIWRFRFKSYRAAGRSLPDSLCQTKAVHLQAVEDYLPQPYSGRVTLFRSLARRTETDLELDLGWSRSVIGTVEIHEVPGDHVTMLMKPHVASLVDKLKMCLEQACGPRDSHGWAAVNVLARAPYEGAANPVPRN